MNQVLRFESHAFGRPYHAARLRIPDRAHDTELHTHADFHESLGIVSGTGEHLLTTGTQELGPRDVVLVRPSDRHAVRGSAPEGLEVVNVAFPTSAWLGFLVLTRTVPAAGWSSARGPVSYRATEAIAVFEDALDRFQAEPGPYDLIRFWIDLLGVLAPAADRGTGDAELAGQGVYSDAPRATSAAASRGCWSWPASARPTPPARCGPRTA